MSKSGAKVRAVAAEVVDAVANGGQSLTVAIAENEQRLAAGDRPLLRMLCYGSLRNYWQLQDWIGQLLKTPLRKRDRVVNALLAVGLYQITEMRIPDHAVVSETVEAVRALRRPKLAGLMNACLRRFVRDGIAATAAKEDTVKWSHPRWLIDRVRTDWPQDWQAVLGANNDRAPMFLRVNALRTTAHDYLACLSAVDIGAELVDGCPNALRLSEPRPVEELPGFFDGDVSVQDAAAQLAAPWLLRGIEGPVLDACAAPGGKSGHLLEVGGPGITLTAVDSDESRVPGIEENLARLGLPATIIAGDASNPEEWWDGEPFSAILLDAPCSASGVIRRHPDIKLLRRESDIGRLARLQAAILGALWPLLAPGGRLLYVTCSVLAAENDEVVGAFLKNVADAGEDDVLPNNNIRDLMRRKACGYQILPGTAGMDGFYFAALTKHKVS